ncbi:hypothetical protein KP509_23G062200 [Ceratopteris richardii]|nr:hypothetical protein KP509_23G062200 [Ceratopteris richardii]KAH7302245.1 hypothetical protein KP509_23G062200 [Ceratopteris richardii]KAH7302246.1 hypothetical protein KP509_23G062200 [Ceratopteris richardii]
MPTLERSPSHSWWWDSHNSPKHSKWLQSSLQDLDEKVKAMLYLIQEDGETFAQRAEMYYQRRPELINLVEDFYRAYRSLAERYDRLTGEIRQNIPRALQLQYGLSCDSPKSITGIGGRHPPSPLRSMSKNSCQLEYGFESAVEEPDNKDNMHMLVLDKCSDIMGHDYDNLDFEFHPNSSDGLSSSSSDSEGDNFTPLKRLQKEINELRERNKILADSHEEALQLKTSLESKVKHLEEDCVVKEKEVSSLRCKLLDLVSQIDVKNKAGQSREGSGVSLDTEMCNTHRGFESSGMDCLLGMECAQMQGDRLFERLCNQFALMREENKKQELVILERGEEKREAIRQLCFSIDALKSENQRLDHVNTALKKRLCAQDTSYNSGRVYPQSHFAAWMQLFTGFKRQQSFVPVAL